MNQVKTLLLNGKTYGSSREETVLNVLICLKATVPYSCMRQSLHCTPPIKPQRDLEETLQREEA
jgi:hypothetical protein